MLYFSILNSVNFWNMTKTWVNWHDQFYLKQKLLINKPWIMLKGLWHDMSLVFFSKKSLFIFPL